MNENSLDVRRQHELEEALLEADNIIMKKYMNNISKFEIKEIDSEIKDVDLNNVFRVNCVEKLVFNTDENNLEKLMNVYNAVGMCGGDIVNIIISDGKNIEYYIGTRTKDLNNIATCQDTLVSAFNGNFPGSVVKAKKKGAMNECIEKVFGSDNNRVVSVVSGIPGYRDEKNKENKKFVQGIERIIDSMSGKAFALVTISSPLSATQITQIKDGYETLYTRISPFATSQLSYNESESNAVAESITDGITETIGDSLTTTLSNSTSNSVGTNTTKSFNGSLILVGESVSNGTNHNYTSQESESSAEAHNSSKSDSHSIGKTDTYTNTNGRALQINIENKSVKNLMDKIDKILLRIEDSADLGLWNTATYCIADDSHTSRVLASAIEALCRGDKNSIENFALDTWTDSTKNEKVKEYLRKMIHPVLLVGGNTGVFEVNPSSLINGKELVIEAGIPQKSVPGLPVSEMIPFSRNVVNELFSGESKLVLGQINHMGQTESTTVELDIESLSAHTLITGSTGSGKSNTVYHILSELKKNDIKFLVVEPAKGEYKNVFGNDNDVKVYSTNENFSELLKINPFKFPKSVHVLEHIDRLIEIFNVCWPMYAAMPAVLKDAVLSAYESCGWDLEESLNSNGNRYYPNFKDLQRELINVIDKTAYSDEIKGNYIGSLATRVKSLTNGINGKIFTNSDLEYSELFDENVIVDLSRVGSCETKSLIMGLLVMSLNEYRMEQSLTEMNQNLRHITVLEEAHNLLRNTSMGGNSEEGGNLAGKSVEMITNSIAEMRTYGEGFIIVDQSPNAIDISAIRNTNTKIIMRLPEESDRKQAGKSAALRDNQIDELAKLKRGIAVVYQNNWLDPVLCAINKADVEIKPYSNSYSREVKRINCSGLLKLLMKNRVDEKIDVDIDSLKYNLEALSLSTKTKIVLFDLIAQIQIGQEPSLLSEINFKKLSDIVVEVLDCGGRVQNYAEFGEDCDLLQKELNKEIERHGMDFSKEMKLAISQCIIRRLVEEDSNQVELYTKWREYAIVQRKLV